MSEVTEHASSGCVAIAIRRNLRRGHASRHAASGADATVGGIHPRQD